MPAAALEPVADRAGLADAERTVLTGFPMLGAAPGTLLPPDSLGVPGLGVWLARRDGAPAGAVAAYDDGASLGIYFLATLPAHRRRGVGRELMHAALGMSPARPAVLTATAAGEPLYAALGFRPAGRGAWWRRD